MKSDDIISHLQPLITQCNKPLKILTDNPSFEYSKIGITSSDIFQTFGKIEADSFDKETFMKKSNSKNLKYFSHINIIILLKDSMWFDESKINNKNDESTLKSIETVKRLDSFGFIRYESKYFYIYINSDC